MYASRTRFIPDSMAALFERQAWPVAAPPIQPDPEPQRTPRLDIGARMRGMWR